MDNNRYDIEKMIRAEKEYESTLKILEECYQNAITEKKGGFFRKIIKFFARKVFKIYIDDGF